MKKSKATIAAILLIISMLAIAYVPKVVGNSSPSHTASIVLTETVTPTRVKYVINVTSTNETSTEYIDVVNMTYPADLTYVSAVGPSGWDVSHSAPVVRFNTTATTFYNNTSLIFNITLEWPLVPPTQGTLLVDCFKGTTPSTDNPVELTISFTPQFEAEISPTHIKGGASYVFNITTTNTGSSVGIKKIDIRYPTGWTFNVLVGYSPETWSVTHNATAKTFTLTGPNILIGSSASIQVNMTTPGTNRDPDHWNSTAWDMNDVLLGTYDLPVVVDAEAPVVTINKPTDGYYSVGSGNYIWINTTVTDALNITKYGMTVTINDTRFELHPTAPREKVSDTEYKYFFVNKTSISDGSLAVKVTATDKAGNSGSAEKSTTVDNTPPSLLWVKVKDETAELPFAAGAFWMSKDTSYLQVNASFYDTATFTGNVYLNTTPYGFTNNTWIPAAPGFNIGTDDYVILNITITDAASPTGNEFTQTWNIYRDEVLPSVPTFTIEAISGGAIIKDITATDNVGILSYKVYVNGSAFVTVSLEELAAEKTEKYPEALAFQGKLVLNLTGYAGKVANITISAIDYGANEGPLGTPVIIDVPEGLWYPVDLAVGWNLMSLPIVPDDPSIESVLSGILADLDAVWSYDAETGTWFSYSPGVPSTLTQMVDGKGYWVKMNVATILIIDGTELPPPPALPPAYKVVPGWNLIGFKETTSMNASDYLAGVVWVRMYDFYDGAYHIVLPDDLMVPGRGYWIAVTEEGWIYP